MIAFDQRSSNENSAPYTTFGYWEKYDLIDIIDYVRRQAPEQTIGIWATSYGGLAAGLALSAKEVAEKVDFLILDSPISSMQWMIEEGLREMDIGLPVSYMIVCGNLVNKWKLGFWYQDADVSHAVQELQIPVLLIHSLSDTVTPPFMAEDLYDAIRSANKVLWAVEDSAHAEIWLDHNQAYRDRLTMLLHTAEETG